MSTGQRFRWRILATWISWRRSPAARRAWPSRRRAVFWVCAMLMTIGVGVYVRAEIHRRVARFDDSGPANSPRSGGTLLIVGGGQLPGMIRQRFVELAGGHRARIVVIPAAAADDRALTQYRETWLAFDIEAVDVLQAESRTEADDPEFSRVLESATGVWLGGGQQTWLAGWYGRTRVQTRLKELLGRNGVIGGTSAGAAVMSGVMIAGGREKPTMGHGFDLIPGAVIDQHFIKRNRFRRLQCALEQHPELVGFGIDEGTALQYDVESGHFRVLGTSCVVACVPRRGELDQRPGYRIEFLNPGDEFDVERLRRGDPIPAGDIDLEAILSGE
jgi:cyanophycinase